MADKDKDDQRNNDHGGGPGNGGPGNGNPGGGNPGGGNPGGGHGPKLIDIVIDGKPFKVEKEKVTGAELKALGGIEANYRLFLEKPGDDEPIPDSKEIKLKDGMEFYSMPPADLG